MFPELIAITFIKRLLVQMLKPVSLLTVFIFQSWKYLLSKLNSRTQLSVQSTQRFMSVVAESSASSLSR